MKPALTRTNFKRLILAYVALMIVLLITWSVDYTIYENMIPLEYQPDEELSNWFLLFGLVSVMIGLWALQNLYALYRFKSYAPKHLLIITIVYLPFYFIEPVVVTVVTAWSQILSEVLLMLSGVILALVWYTPLADEFTE